MSARLLTRVSFVVGALGLLAAMTLDAAAVVGRQLGWPLLGSIELISAAVVIAGSSALVGATLERSHASIHLLSERLPARLRAASTVAARLVSAAFFAWLAAGSIWVAAELWHSGEVSELLQLPLRPLRVFWCASALLVTLLFLRSTFERPWP